MLNALKDVLNGLQARLNARHAHETKGLKHDMT